MTRWVTRQQAGLEPPRSPGHMVRAFLDGVVIHHVGTGPYAQIRPEQLWRDIQAWHYASPVGYRDIAYNLGVGPGVILEGRSTAARPNSNPGATGHMNDTTFAVCALWGTNDGDPTEQLLDTLGEAVAWLRSSAGAADHVSGHRDHMQTACPGRIYPHLNDVQRRASGDDMGLSENEVRDIVRQELRRNADVIADAVWNHTLGTDSRGRNVKAERRLTNTHRYTHWLRTELPAMVKPVPVDETDDDS